MGLDTVEKPTGGDVRILHHAPRQSAALPLAAGGSRYNRFEISAGQAKIKLRRLV
jgi:hypothetical protein